MTGNSHVGARWCVALVRAGSTLKFAAQLREQGLVAWAPAKTIRRPAPGQRRALVLGTRRKMIEVEVPILPGFVFVAAINLFDLARCAALPPGTLPPFAVLQVGGRTPEISDSCVAGLREAETAERTRIDAERDADQRDEARRLRADQLRTHAAKKRALRRESRSFVPGQQVTVSHMPALTGIVGTVIHGEGPTTRISFGGSLVMSVEAWRVVPNTLCDVKLHGIAA